MTSFALVGLFGAGRFGMGCRDTHLRIDEFAVTLHKLEVTARKTSMSLLNLNACMLILQANC